MTTTRLLDEMVRQNRDILEYLRHAHSIGNYSMKVGSLDYAISRINTIILKLSQYPLLANRYFCDLAECHDAVREFHLNMRREESWPKIFRWYPQWCIKRIGRKKFPLVLKLYHTIENSID